MPGLGGSSPRFESAYPRARFDPGLPVSRGSILRGQSGYPASHPSDLATAARDFEAMAIGQLLEPMFQTVDTAHGLFGGGDSEAAWKPMFVDAISKKIAERGGFGLSGPVLTSLLRAQEAQTGTRQ